ncbi:hypothetical protein [Phaeobacter gallaeciensis]|uniref:hypothetical protein n=1 Tax=Phaeobacter gallaeciensis TaxID=60890 RepID=UPI00237F36F2|nr:hypothetical protein [Phaeobacter gallaeciensis]MDE4059754.1 hypothetical protein [Phaeobacter gallaeciensis]MDE4122609.1 hypothetical protein [Phaeobacter gallaeciensis]MDE4127241.1 hypothetical protein [Phaeobacter gallaeciensis]
MHATAATKNAPQEKLLSTPEAIEYLAEIGVRTSRGMLDRLRAQGELRYVKARGAIRILYRPADLKAAYLEDRTECPSHFSDAKPAGHTTRAAQSQDSAFTKARALAAGQTPKRGQPAGKRNSCNVTRLAKRQR